MRLAPEWGYKNEPFREQDFEMISELGFNFVRLPISYKCWTEEHDWYRIKENHLKEIDQAVDWGKQYGIHVCINFHRAPGYTINSVDNNEGKNLWKDEEALEACAFHWRLFAERYRDVNSDRLSFNLLNEPNNVSIADHARVIRRLVHDIREIDNQRLIIIDACKKDGFFEPALDLLDLNLVESARGYDPTQLTHYKATWAEGSEKWDSPTWPMSLFGEKWDKQMLEQQLAPFRKLANIGHSVFVGEFGCYNQTSHTVALSWMGDVLSLFKSEKWGWAMWCFRGSFGILDSNRKDVKYESFKGHMLDKKMLSLLQCY